MKCSNCHTEVEAGAKFCPKCGTPVGVAMGQTMASVAPGVPMARTKSIPPELIAGRYRIFEKLGEGAMGAVYKGEQISLKRPVAVKLLKSSLSTDKTLVRRFNAEAEAVAKLSHPNTVNIHDFGQEKDGSLFIVMELVEGRTLRSAIEQEAPFSPQRALFIAGQIAASIGDAHARSIIHRDLKPDNVMLQTRGRVRDIVRVLDFGIAKLRDDNKATMAAMTQAGDMLGTPQYMAPEQVLGDPVDGRVDIYALGCIIYEMVTARRVFDAQNVTEILTKHLSENVVPPSQRRPDLKIPPEIDRLVLTATMKQAAARPPTMEVYGEQIAAVLAALPREPGQSSSEALPVAYAPASGAIAAVGGWATPPAGTPHVSPQTPPAGLSPVGRVSSPQAGVPHAHSPSSGLPQIAPTVAVTPPGGLPPAGRAHTPSSGYAPRAHTPSSGYPPTHTPPSGLPPAQRTPSSALSSTDVGHRHSSRAPLFIGVAVVSVAIVSVIVYVVLQKDAAPKVATNDQPGSAAVGSNAPTGSAATPGTGSAGSAATGSIASRLPGVLPGTGSATPRVAAGSSATGSGAGSEEPTPYDAPSGQTVSAVSGFKLIVPPGFTTQRQGKNLIARTKGYTIVVGPITSKQLDPEVAAKEYAELTGLTLDGVADVELAGVSRPGAAFHGTLYGEEVAQSIINYIGPGYRVAVSLTYPNAYVNDPAVRKFADELFSQRVIVP